MIKYPEKPWVDKQTFTHETQAGDKIAGIYDAPTNTWSFYKGNSDLVFTNTVYTVNVKPADTSIALAGQLFNDALPLPTVDDLVTQQDVNWYLYDLINSIDGGSQIWIGIGEPPGTDEANPITKFWWKDDEEQLYVWDTLAEEWKLTGLMDFDRPPIIGNIEPLEHPKFPGKPIEQGDLWYNTSRLELFIYWMGAWFPTSAPSVGFDGVSTETFTFTINRIQSLIDEVYLKNIEQDGRLDVLEENIVELEEEIDAIAPSNERGEWTFNPLGVASPSNYAFLDSNTQPTERFDSAAIIYVSTRDADNVTHSFSNHEAGEYLQIFNKEDDGYGLYQITDIDDNSTSPNPFFAFTVDFVRSLVTVPKAVGRGRFKFFTIADGDPGAYVLKTGDEMSGDLTFKKDPFEAGDSPNIVFKARDPLLNDRTGTLYLSGDENRLKSNTSLRVNGHLEANKHVKGEEVRTTKLTSGQNTNLGIYRGSGADEAQKILVGTDSVNFHVDVNLLNNDVTNVGNVHSQYYRGHPTTQASDAFVRLTSGGGYLNFDGNHERVAWKEAGGHLKGASNKTFEWDDTGITYLRANSSTGSSGQVLTKTSSGLQWATPASGGGHYFGRKFIYSNQTSGTPAVGKFCFHSSRLWINETDVDGIQYRHTVGDYSWNVPFYVFATSSQHTLMASMLTTQSDYSASGYTKWVSSGWNHNSLTSSQVYYCKMTGLW